MEENQFVLCSPVGVAAAWGYGELRGEPFGDIEEVLVGD